MGLRRDNILGLSLALVNISLYSYLVAHLNWAGTINFVVSLLFFSTSTFFLTWNLGYAYAIHRRSRHPQASHPPIPEYSPTVAIIVPLYRESLGSLWLMIKGFTALNYSPEKLRLYLCDDTEDPAHRVAAQRLCLETGDGRVHYCSRDHRRGYKAGAVNDILPRITSEYCIMLDADHVPQPDMVRRLMAAKLHSKADFLMFPQYFRNESENSVTVASSLKQLVDYKIERLGRCSTNSAFCVTTNWIAETEALRGLGGLDESTVTEDLATGLIAHGKGLRISVFDEKLALGLAPNTLQSWRNQQFRWSSGTFDVAKNIFPRVWRKLTWHQRLDYSLCITWYLSGLFSFLLYLFPIFTAVGVRFFRYGSVLEFLAFTLSLIGICWVLTSYPAYLESRSLRKTLIAQAASLGVGDVYVKALVSMLAKRKDAFAVTGKGKSGQLRIGTALHSLKYHLLFLAVGFAAAFYSLMTNRSLDAIVNVSWIAYNNLWVIFSALLLGKNS